MGSDIEVVDLCDLSGLTDIADIMGRRTELLEAQRALVEKKAAINDELHTAYNDFRCGGRGRPFQWRRQREVTLERLKSQMLAVNSALAALRTLRTAAYEKKNPLAHLPHEDLRRIACHFVCVCEDRLEERQMRELWKRALGRFEVKAKIRSVYLEHASLEHPNASPSPRSEASDDNR